MLRVEIPQGRVAERRYAVSTVLGHLLGVESETVVGTSPTWRVTCPSAGAHRTIELPDTFFASAAACWQAPASLPRDPARWLRVDEVELPDFYPAGDGGTDAGAGAAVPSGGTERFPIDVFGVAFFVLSRYEESVLAERDALDRVPLASTSLGRGDWLETPVVDELAAALWCAVERTWPGLPRRRREYDVRLTHDVDALRNAGRGFVATARALAVDVLLRRDARLAAGRVAAALAGPRRLHPRDPYNTFDFLMHEAERRGLRSHFYFVPRSRNRRYDPDYDMREPVVIDLLRRIAARGHRIGLHASFDAAWRADGIAEDLRDLREAFEAAGVRQDEVGGRHHYLRWRPDASWQEWDAAGLDYDSSVGFAECPGFRCGTSHAFPAWSFARGSALRLLERPLVVMDSTLYNYLRLGHRDAVERVRRLAAAARRHDGSLVLLWHNHNFLAEGSREAFSTALDAATGR